ncbi:MAG: 3-deoxy-7-phosphoheptulonate synthase [Phycisphaeraceae bacterium]|nr:3-deoxy-7-phosphoheptulonate synthase [Phycisphaeraceae bacterium]
MPGPSGAPLAPLAAWTPDSWRSRPAAHMPAYPDAARLESALRELASLPPLVTSWEIERLKALLAGAQRGERFVLQGGDCAESLDECTSEAIASKLKILLQMSLVLVHGIRTPVVRIGRFAGQYAKPRSSPTETRVVDGASVTLPSYFGDQVNRAAFAPESRTPDPGLMVLAHQRAALTLNFVRSLIDAGFADLHHPEYWDLSFFSHASLTPERRGEYEAMARTLADALKFMEALGEKAVDDLQRVEFFTSHEGLNLLAEQAVTRTVPRRPGHYNLSTHMPWIGERTRALDGAHVEYFRGIANPIGVKIGATASGGEVIDLVRLLNPAREAGKVVLITRFGAGKAAAGLAPLLAQVHGAAGDAGPAGIGPVLWMCDPMHANGLTTPAGVKTRSFDAILAELHETIDAHGAAGTRLGGVHFELTGEDVTECIGGASGVTEDTLHVNYASACDPRLNYAQSLELAFLLAGRLAGRG